MREILFRGKRKDNGEWAEGFFLSNDNKAYILAQGELTNSLDEGELLHTCWVHEVDPETVGRFTGLYDKNSRPIYEGDYILAVLPATTLRREFVWPIMPVVYSRGAFGLADSHGEVTPLCGFAPYVTFEVVGNVHDAEYRSDTQQEATEQ